MARSRRSSSDGGRGRGGLAAAPLLLAAAVALAAALTAAPPAEPAEPPAPGPPAAAPPAEPSVTFASETVAIAVEDDSLRVDGYYVLRCREGLAGGVSLYYPFPRDPDLGGARLVSVAASCDGGPWEPAAWRARPDRAGVFWRLPAPARGRLEVRCTYRQARRGAYLRYIVTTVHGWGRPLERARFTVELPDGARAPEFSFPFAPGTCAGRPCWVYETVDFLPDRDIVVRWR